MLRNYVALLLTVLPGRSSKLTVFKGDEEMCVCVHLKCHHHIMALSSVCVYLYISKYFVDFSKLCIVLTGVADPDT